MLHFREMIKPRIQSLTSLTASTMVLLIHTHVSTAIAATVPGESSEQPYDVQQPNAHQAVTGEVSIEAKRQTAEAERETALAKQAITISDTPDAGPQSKHLSVVLGLGAGIGPAYLGSKIDKGGVIPYVDVRGLLGGRLYISDIGGLGLNLIESGPFRAGLNVSLAGGRKSSADPHLRGLPNINDSGAVGGFLAYSYESFAFEGAVSHRVGSHPETDAALGATYSVSPIPRLQMNVSSSLTWSSSLNTLFGVTPEDAVRTAAVGNPLPVYSPGSGLLTFSAAATAVYQLRDHWGLVARAGVVDLVGSAVRDSPLTLRTLQPNVAIGVLYIF
jgi:outer membrane scaffolding protein for murein synthesis (MipA/OmpV family)